MPPENRILIFPFGLLSHYLRCITLAQRFYGSYEILFAGHPEYDRYVLDAGFKTFSCECFDAELVMKHTQKFDFSWLNEKDIDRVFLSQVKAIEHYKPAVVIGDVSPSLRMAAEFTCTDHHALPNGYMTKNYSFTRRLSRTHKAYAFSRKVPPKYFDLITAFAEAVSFQLVHRPFKKLRKKYKMKRVSDYLSEMEGGKNLICDLIALFPQKKIPTNYYIIGPLMYNSGLKEGEWLHKIDRTKPIICVCMGSSGNWKALNFLNNKRYSIYTIITAGDLNREIKGPHVISRDFINLNEVLSHSSLMICHGGNGTLYHGLLNGVFMLCLTAHFEQEWNVHALERIGYGRSANDFDETGWEKNIEASVLLKPEPYTF